ncbi:MAG: mechanosensitive ion channel family protein [Sulfitobacter sp.]
MKHLLVILVACLGLWLAPQIAHAQDTASGDALAPAPSANDLHEFTRLLSDDRIQNWIVQQADDANLADTTEALSMRDRFDLGVAELRARLNDVALAQRALPETPALFAENWRAQIDPAQQVRVLNFLMIFLFVGAGLEWLFRQYTNPLKLRIELQPVETIRHRFANAGLRSLIALGGLGLFALGSIGAFATFKWPPAFEEFVISLLVVILIIRVISTVLVLFLAPRVPELRLLPLSNAMSKMLAVVLLTLTSIYILTGFFKDVYAGTVGDAGGLPDTLAVSIAMAFLSLLATYVALWISFRQIAKQQGSALRKSQRMWRLYLAVLATIAFVILTLGQEPLMWTVVLLGLLFPSLRLLRMWVDNAFDRQSALEAARRTHVIPEPTDIALNTEADAVDSTETDGDVAIWDETPTSNSEGYRPIAQRLVRILALFLTGLVVMMIWDVNVFERAASPTVLGRIVALIIDSAVALLIADLVWVWASSAIDRRLNAYKPPEPGTAPGPEARMATLLPLLRVTLMITLLAMVAMSVLTSLGVNVAPLLAGAGVIGVAIGFGAQSLVKDVVSGIFFLIDDAFRVGEYVEIDNLRGTVERISIRSLQIRHHRGAVHTLPFGELRHLTNHSRDWVIMKLEFRVPFDTDLKLVKKLIKGIGAQMKEHEEYGDSIIETLKSQGVRRMEEFNMVVGVKFMTRPGEQWLVRRDAYQMVRDAFDANGIRMAERNVKVEVAGAENMTEEERQAVAGAAQQAVERQIGPGAPIPDEP